MKAGSQGCKVLLQHKRTQEEQECHVFPWPGARGKAEIGFGIFFAAAAFCVWLFPSEDWISRSGSSTSTAARIRKFQSNFGFAGATGPGSDVASCSSCVACAAINFATV